MIKTAFIFARGGSKGLPGKNIRNFCGKPLIAWSIEQALSVPEIDRVIVSTDSQEIALVAREFGADVPFIRPAKLALDESAEWLSWQHALNYLKEIEGNFPDAMISIPTTAPLRLSSDISSCLEIYKEFNYDSVVTVTESNRNPYFNMLKKTGTDFELVIQQDMNPVRRQDALTVYDMTTICYVVNSQFIIESRNLFEGRIGAHVVPPERSIDIDTLLDFKIAEFIHKERGQ
jgi:N-acylneuraminate cytidylyltransferase